MESMSFSISFDRRPTAQKINSANYAARISAERPRGTAGSWGFHDSPWPRGHGAPRGARLRAFNDMERRLCRITVGYPSARVTFRTSRERSRDIPRGPGTFVSIRRLHYPGIRPTNRPFPRRAPARPLSPLFFVPPPLSLSASPSFSPFPSRWRGVSCPLSPKGFRVCITPGVRLIIRRLIASIIMSAQAVQ